MRPPLTVPDALPEERAATPEPRLLANGPGFARRLASLDGAIGASLVFVGALALFALQSLAVSLVLGRDAEDYVIHGWELFDREPLFPKLMLERTPVSGADRRRFYALGGAIGLEIGLGRPFRGRRHGLGRRRAPLGP